MEMGVHIQALTALSPETITLFVGEESEIAWTLWKREKPLSRAGIRTLAYPIHSQATIPITGNFIFKVFAIDPFLLSSTNSLFVKGKRLCA
jgi:hypothetical protein